MKYFNSDRNISSKEFYDIMLSVNGAEFNRLVLSLINNSERYRFKKGFEKGLTTGEINEITSLSLFNLYKTIKKKESTENGETIENIGAYFTKVYLNEVFKMVSQKMNDSRIILLDEFSDKIEKNLVDIDVYDAEANELREESIAEIVKAINYLNPKEQQLVSLIHFEGESHKEAGELLGISEDTSKTTTSRARKKLKKLLGIKTNNKTES